MKPIYFKYLSLEDAAKALQPRSKEAQKGDFGHVLVIAGNYGMAGAARLCGEAALSIGAGLVTVATRTEHARTLGLVCPELMTVALEKPHDLTPALERATVIAMGPGLGKDAWAQSLLEFILESSLPMVLDADALNLLSDKTVKNQKENWILTPHPGEAGRLLNKTASEIQQNRIDAILSLQKKYHGVIVLKGAGTLVLGDLENLEEVPEVCPYGNPGMAAPGMGDVLTGVIAGLLAQKMSKLQAAKLGVLAHALAGDKVAKEKGERGFRASDLIRVLPQCLQV